ncbi:MAG: hypothetical protein Q8N99_05765 [Nanoarchaeota archaeon]|nr:hypothetical protein [Nanoarchaeota archaeon]
MSLEKVLTIGRNIVHGLILTSALIAFPYAMPLTYSAEPTQARGTIKEIEPRRFLGESLWVTSQKALGKIGFQGGYYKTTPDERLDLKERGFFVPYYYDRGKILMPEIGTIEKEISGYVETHFLEELKSQGKIRFIPGGSKIQTNVKIKKGIVEFNHDISLIISENNMYRTRFNTKINPTPIPSKLYEMIEIAKFITDSHKEDPDMMNITKLAEMAKERNLRVESIGFDDLPNCTYYKIVKRKKGESSIQLGGLSDNTDPKEKEVEDSSGLPNVFQFLNRYLKDSAPKVPQAPAPRMPSAPKADPSA